MSDVAKAIAKLADKPIQSAFLTAEVTDVGTMEITLDVIGIDDPVTVPTLTDTYPEVGSTVLLAMNGDEPIPIFQTGEGGSAFSPLLQIFGTGEEGAITLTRASAAPAWATKTGSGATTQFALDQDVYATTMTLDDSGGSFYVKTNGYRIFVNDTLTIDAGVVVGHKGNDAVADTAGLAPSSGTIGTGNTGAGASGGSGSGSSSGSGGQAVGHSLSVPLGSLLVTHGGQGGSGSGTSGLFGGGGAGGVATHPVTDGVPNNVFDAINARSPRTQIYDAGAGGGSGGKQSLSQSGGGGGGGGLVMIAANKIANDGSISAVGGHGGDAAIGGNALGAGGGGGGGGGAIILVFHSGDYGTLDVSGGIGGHGAGTWGQEALDGSDGLVYVVQV